MNIEYLFIYLWLLISFINVLFSVYRSFTSLVKFIPMYFILLDVIVNGTIFLISLSDHVTSVWNHNWLLYTDFMSWNFTEFIIPKFFLWRVFIIVLCHLQIVTISLLPFWFGYLLFLFLAWLFWLILPILYWIKMVRVDKFVLFLILEEKLLTFHYWV